MIKAALDHGEIPKNIKAIPKSKLIRELKSLSEVCVPIEKIMTGIKNKRTIKLPIEKLVLFNKFIDAEIDPKQDKINEPIINVKIKLYTSLIGRLKKIQAIGIEAKKGICTKKKCDSIFNKTINS